MGVYGTSHRVGKILSDLKSQQNYNINAQKIGYGYKFTQRLYSVMDKANKIIYNISITASLRLIFG